MSVAYRGHLVHVAGSGGLATAADDLVSEPDGVVIIGDDGVIIFSGAWNDCPTAPPPPERHPSPLPELVEGPPGRAEASGAEQTLPPLPELVEGLEVVDRRGCYLLPGFVDTHLHYPQTLVTDSVGGGQLLEWLERCVFPAEARLADDDHAAQVAAAFVARRVAVGTTAAMVFGSAFPSAQQALFEATAAAGLRIVSGRGIQTVGSAAAAPLITDEDAALTLATDEIERWHRPDGLAQVALVPRFSLSVTRRTLAGLGELYEAYRDRGVYVHSHLNENDRPGDGEIAQVRAAYGVEHYLDTYDGRFGAGSTKAGRSLLGPRTIMAHAVHCSDAELDRLAGTGTSVAHCPTSQLFLGSGTLPWRRTVAAGVNVALGSDIGAGDEWLLPRVLNDCFKVHLSEPGPAAVALHPAELLYTATRAGARALDQEHRFGNLDPGQEADLVIIDPSRQPGLAERLAAPALTDDPARARDAELFTLLLGLREPAVAEVLVAGRRVG